MLAGDFDEEAGRKLEEKRRIVAGSMVSIDEASSTRGGETYRFPQADDIPLGGRTPHPTYGDS